MNFFKGYVLGSGGVMPSVDRNLTCIYGKTLKSNFLLDIGENAQRQILKNSLPFFVDFITLSHNHLDHVSGLFGYLNTMKLLMRTSPLKIYCVSPEYLQKALLSLNGPKYFEVLPYKLDLIKIIPEVEYLEKDLVLKFFKVRHTVPCYGIEITSINNTKYNKSKLQSTLQKHEIERLMLHGKVEKEGKTFLREQFVESEDPYFKVCYSGDTYWDLNVLKRGRKALMIHQCTHFKNQDLAKSRETLHTHFKHVKSKKTLDLLNKLECYLVLLHFGPKMDLLTTQKLNKKFRLVTNRLIFAQDNMKLQFTGKTNDLKVSLP